MSLSHCCPNKTGREVMKGRDWRAKTLAGSIVRNDEVVGSIPTSSTKPFNHLQRFPGISSVPLCPKKLSSRSVCLNSSRAVA
jgi:hypothetical protein